MRPGRLRGIDLKKKAALSGLSLSKVYNINGIIFR